MDSTPVNLPGPDSLGIDRIQFFRDCESGGAWPFLVRGVNCLLNCDNGRDLRLVIEACECQVAGEVCAGGFSRPLLCCCCEGGLVVPPAWLGVALFPSRGLRSLGDGASGGGAPRVCVCVEIQPSLGWGQCHEGRLGEWGGALWGQLCLYGVTTGMSPGVVRLPCGAWVGVFGAGGDSPTRRPCAASLFGRLPPTPLCLPPPLARSSAAAPSPAPKGTGPGGEEASPQGGCVETPSLHGDYCL